MLNEKCGVGSCSVRSCSVVQLGVGSWELGVVSVDIQRKRRLC